jgi:hypothetical protein
MWHCYQSLKVIWSGVLIGSLFVSTFPSNAAIQTYQIAGAERTWTKVIILMLIPSSFLVIAMAR